MVARRDTPLARARKAAGFTQESLASVVGMERVAVGRWERGEQTPQPWHRHRLAAALGVSLVELDDLLRHSTRDYSTTTIALNAAASVPDSKWAGDAGAGAEVGAVHSAVPRLRRVLDRLDVPDDGPTRVAADLRGEIVRACEDRLQSRYGSLACCVPDLIAELARAGQLGDAAGRREAAALLTLALRAADGVAFKFGYLDLSARLIDLMRSAAQLAEDPLLLAAVAYVRTETFFATGDLDTAIGALERAADEVPLRDTVSSSAAFGALHMRAAVVAGRAGKAELAADHMGEARRVAVGVPEGVYQGTAFGPASVRIHELAVAVELRDPQGIDRAASWDPPRQLPAERRSHYFIDLARARLDLGRPEAAYNSLQAARAAAPEHTRTHPQVRQTLSTLLHSQKVPGSAIADLAAWAHAR